MSRPINQHWVPQFYLRGFATPETRCAKEAQVWILSRRDSDGIEQLTNVRNVCAKRYLYAPKDRSGERSWESDDRLKCIETLLAPMWRAVSEDFIALDDDSFRKALALFAASMTLRHPDRIEEVSVLHSKIVEQFDSAPKHSDGTPAVNSLLHRGKEHRLNTSGWNEYKTWGKNDHHRFFANSISTQTGNLAKLLLQKRWSVIFSETDQFVTSDRPVAIQNHSARSFGFETPGTIVFFPLSPRRMLAMDDTHEEPANQYYPMNPNSIGAFNYGTWHTTARFLITGRSIKEVLEEMQGWMASEGFA